MRRSSLTECWVGLVFSSPAVSMKGTNVTQVDDVFGAGLATELPDRFQVRQRLDVADRAADLRDDDVGVRHRRDTADAVLISFVMCGMTWTVAEVLALALLADDRVPDRAGRRLAFRERFSSMKRS